MESFVQCRPATQRLSCALEECGLAACVLDSHDWSAPYEPKQFCLKLRISQSIMRSG